MSEEVEAPLTRCCGAVSMRMTGVLEADYVVVGAGAMGMAFVDALGRPR